MATWALLGVFAVTGTSVALAAGPDPRVEKVRAETLDDDFQKDLPGTEEHKSLELNGGPFGDRGGRHGGGGGGDGGRDDHGGTTNDHNGDGSADGASGSGDPRQRYDRNGRVRDDNDPISRHRRDTRTDESLDAGPLSGIFRVLLWGVMIVGLALLLFWIGAELMRYGGNDVQLAGKESDDAGASGVDLAVIQRPLGDAEELAARGEYTEAIHTLLLRTLQELVRSAAVRVAPAMTSREILARVPLLADARDALAGLITAVEITHFGGDQATLDDYLRCRAQFQKFATAFRQGGSPVGGGVVGVGTGTRVGA